MEAIRVLHVDDEPAVAALVAEFLEREDGSFDVVTETNVDDGLDRLTEDRLDCIVSDYQMPGMGGLEFLSAVRETDPDLPFILFTGRGSEAVASDALSTGATDYLQKDTGIEQYELLANRIKNWVESHRNEKRASHLERVRTMVRDVNQALVRASSRQEIETQVCEIISDPESVEFVVFSEIDPDTNRVEPRTWAGIDDGAAYLDAIDITVGEPTDDPQTPHERAIHERGVAVTLDIEEDAAFDPWLEAVTESGFHALAVVPIEYEADLYGLLALYGGRPQPVDDARDLLAELGSDIAHAFYAIDTQRELEESEARYRNLAETASDAILRIDETSTITYANPATEQLFGYSRAELHGESLTELMPERLRDQHSEGIERYLQTGERQLDWTGVELFGQHEDGTEIPLSITFGEFEQEDQRVFTGILRDVTKRAERKAELQRQIEYLDEFAGTVAHDLKNPLNVVTGRLELVEAECDSDHLDAAMATLERMNDIIEDLLVLAQQGQTVDDADAVSVAAVADAARGSVDSDAVTVETEPDLGTIVGRPSSVRALVENLVRNAVEHGSTTPRSQAHEDAVEHGSTSPASDTRQDAVEHGSTTPRSQAHEDAVGTCSDDPSVANAPEDAVEHAGPDVTIRVTMLDDGFAVEDDGPGIPEDERDDVFEPGYTTKQGGTGFGLNIVRKIVDAHGWDIAVTDSVDGGARFEITGVDVDQ